ncbi:LysM peptidoglycan-binding domain-containing protein [Kangiella sediminilitoris]|uniref:Peptidoglycan-binding LysM n=1 Tax=Kangiella sediminilitoris TaxID=1144748 RepID=A0A1B3BDV2_9GAMM|nr:LysM peptidoglycan-binding domain-containing protein [Kangiella sediminilitoris]AOE51009.1 Peptidoglycan-binding LysM [Kangiella sediminilitoris]
MKKILTAAAATAALFLGSIAQSSQEVELRADHPDTYVVEKGDTLWDISGRFLTKPWNWPEIWHVNPQVENPHLIYPGDILKLVYIDGKPYLVKASDGTIKLRPKARVLSEGDAITTIPMEIIRPFLINELVVDDASIFDEAPYVVALAEERVISGGLDDRLYIRGLDAGQGSSYGIYRQGKEYRDPVTNELLGIEARYLANGEVIKEGDPATLDVKKSKLEVLRGDVALPRTEDPMPPLYAPRAPKTDIEAQLISVYGGVSQIGQYHVVTLNKGERDGLEEGHVLTVYQRGKKVIDQVAEKRGEEDPYVTLPEERAGTLMVFRTYEKVSLALIMDAERPMHLFDVARNPY